MVFLRGLGDLSVSMNTWQASRHLACDMEIALKRLTFQISLLKKDWKAQSRSLGSSENEDDGFMEPREAAGSPHLINREERG